MSQAARFWDKAAERYASKPVASQAAHQKKLQITQQYLQPHMEVLEIGCGTGSTALIHAPLVKHVLAIDFSCKMIEIAQGKAETQGIANVTFKCADISSLDIPDATVDAVLALNVLHLLDNWDHFISEVYRMLKLGGVFISSTACLNDMMKLLKFVAPIGQWVGLMPPLTFFSRSDLIGCLASTGFGIDYEWQPDNKSALFIVAKKPQHVISNNGGYTMRDNNRINSNVEADI